MIAERMVFELKYGRQDDAVELLKEMFEELKNNEATKSRQLRFMTGLSGRAYTVYEDILLKSFNEINPLMYYWVTNAKVQELYRKFVDHCDLARREMYNIECEVGSIKNFQNLVVEKNVFQLRFGQAKESIALWKEILDLAKNNNGPHLRLMTDLVGPSYTLMVEAFWKDMSHIKPRSDWWNMIPETSALYQKFIPLCYWANREYYVVEFDM